MSKVGIRIAQAGIPVDQAADYQKTMDERWPVVEHIFMGAIDLTDMSTSGEGVLHNAGDTIADIPIHHHGLGYLPAFRFIPIAFSSSTGVIGTEVFADEQDIYFRVLKDPGALAVNIRAFMAIVDRDCNVDYQAPIDIVTATQVTKPSKYGLKILQGATSQGMAEKQKAGYTFNTNAKSMQIQQHGTRTANAQSIPAFNLVIQHRLGYPPTYFIAKKTTQIGAANPSLGKTTIEPLNPGFGISKSNSITLTIRGAQSALQGDYLFVILKDPVDTAR